MRRLMHLSIYRTIPQGHARALLVSSLVLTFLLCCSSAYGQEAKTIALADLSHEMGSKVVTPTGVPVHYGLPVLRKPLPNFAYPIKAQTFQIEGRVIVQFLLDERGKVKDPEIIKSLGYGCDEEVLRVLRQGRFEPTLNKEGKAQPTQFVTAFDFQLDKP
ncbi:MAG TPA: energy transducer TonB [Rhodothermales bacterium]|nr:energy transducer TonB [Rhodothermales bacterium]